jgi:Elongation factor Tu domain 2
MATRKKGKSKSKSKGKRKKTRVTKAATRTKTRRVKKTSAVGKNPRKKAARRTSPKKAKATPKAAVKPMPASPSAQPVTATQMPSLPAQPAPPGVRIGIVTHYYSHLSVATLRLESGTLRVGDMIHIRGHTTDFSQTVESLEVNHAPATEVGPNDDFGLKVVQHAREHDVVYKARP